MTVFGNDPIASGRPYCILTAGGDAPSTLDQFLGEASFRIAKDGAAQSLVHGHGSPHDGGVRFHEKNAEPGGKDVRIWQISQGDSGAFTAAATAAF